MAMLGVIRGLRTVVRRWWVIVVLVALGAGVGVGTAPSTAERLRHEAGSATAELVLAPGERQTTQQLELAARVARQPEVAEAAARSRLSEEALFAKPVMVSLDRADRSVRITARTGDPAASVDLASGYAAAAARYIAQTTGVELRPAGDPVPGTGAQGILPDHPSDRGALGALAGLLLGLALATTVLPGRDGRLHDRRALERSYACPVLAEIPRIAGRARYAGHVAFLTRPTGTVAEAYRVLRCAVLNRGRGADSAPRVIAVTSPGRGDGRSSVARNLAAALAESGRRVLLVDCDFGHPTAHFGVGIQPGTGLSDLLAAPDPGARLAEIVQPTETPGVRVLSIGTRGGREPGQLAVALPQVLAVGRRMVDAIVLDCEPLECAGDALDVLDVADAALIVARAGRTRRRSATRAADMLERCGVHIAGVVLIGDARESEARTPYLVSPPPALVSAGPMSAGPAAAADRPRHPIPV